MKEIFSMKMKFLNGKFLKIAKICIKWENFHFRLILQKQSDTIEEVTDEILLELIEEHEYVAVYFSGDCDEGDKCDDILEELENIGKFLVESNNLKGLRSYFTQFQTMNWTKPEFFS